MSREEEILTRCIDDIKADRTTLPECLERYPDMAAELEPLVKVALSITEEPDIRPSTGFKARARADLMDYIASHPKKKVSLLSGYSFEFVGFTGWARAAAVTGAVILALAAAGTGTAYASQSSLPGENLYPVKLGTEQVRRIFTFDSVAEVKLELELAGVRLNEMETLACVPEYQSAAIEHFSGEIVEMSFPDFGLIDSGYVYLTQPEKIALAAAGYERNLNLAIIKSEKMNDNEELLEKVALAISGHLERLDGIEDKAPDEIIERIIASRTAAINGHMNAVRNLAAVNPSRAEEINLNVIASRQKRAETEALRGNSNGALQASQEMEKLRTFGNEIHGKQGNSFPEEKPETIPPSKTEGAGRNDNGQPFNDQEKNQPESNQPEFNQEQETPLRKGYEDIPPETIPVPETVPGETGGGGNQPESPPDAPGTGEQQGNSFGEESKAPEQPGHGKSHSPRKLNLFTI